ncbi:hypothetical protein PROFUN_00087 [Planoprotostelium fungivorum]|uniref:F-box domain-containing protein n=1 Tax=Planoprotostelium fungivorum TaxID=1890364 RepID=A0A2P6P0L4_9EUKA|nr:hypothetical protein PROFUN_00087 [Planoprotostelium fungivorum]
MFARLPEEIILHILRDLHPLTLLNVSRASRLLRRLTDDVWRYKYKEMGFLCDVKSPMEWKKYFFQACRADPLGSLCRGETLVIELRHELTTTSYDSIEITFGHMVDSLQKENTSQKGLLIHVVYRRENQLKEEFITDAKTPPTISAWKKAIGQLDHFEDPSVETNCGRRVLHVVSVDMTKKSTEVRDRKLMTNTVAYAQQCPMLESRCNYYLEKYKEHMSRTTITTE